MVLVATKACPNSLESNLDRSTQKHSHTHTHAHTQFRTPKKQYNWFGLINLMCNSLGGGHAAGEQGDQEKKENSHPPKQGF